MCEERFSVSDGYTIMDNECGFDMGLEEVCELLNEYVEIIRSLQSNF